MPYVPLNRVATDLYTNGGEYVYQSTQTVYVGPYHKYYNGEIYTNTTPDIPNPQKLIKLNKLQDLNTSNSRVTLGIGNETQHPDLSESNIEEQLQQIYQSDPSRIIENYLQAKNSSIQQYRSKISIQSYNPEPTLENYQVGEFQRYFVKQINGLKYMEVDKNTYTAINSRNPKYTWEYYISINIPWSITGEERQVMTTNKNIVELAERSRNITGLSQFLHYNYLKFYKK